MKGLIKRLLVKLKNRKRISLAKNVNVTVNSEFEGNNKINQNTSFDGHLGYSSYVGPDCSICGYVGKYCSIGSGVTVVRGKHPISEMVSSSPIFYSNSNTLPKMIANSNSFNEHEYIEYENASYPVVIKNDVWIGTRAMIMEGVTIGDGAVIAAGAIVTHDVPPYAIVAGVPAKVLRYRFEQHTIEYLCKYEWWNKDNSWIIENANLFSNVDLFIEKTKDETVL